MIEKLFEKIIASYSSYGEDNKSLQLSLLVEVPDTLKKLITSILVWYHSLGLIFCVKILDLIWSSGQVAVSNHKERRHLREPIGGQCQNSGSPDRRKSGGDGGLVLARSNRGLKPQLSLVKGSRDISTKVSLPAGFEKLGNLRESNTTDKTTVNTKVLDLLSDIDILIAAYSKLNSYPGNITPEMDSEIMDGIDRP